MRRSRFISLAVATLALASCADPSRVPTAPTAGLASADAALASHETATARWHALALTVSGRRESGPLAPTRTFALISVARYNGVVAAAASHEHRASQAGAAAGAAAAVLEGLYPMEHDAIAGQLHADAAYFASLPSEHGASFADGVDIGRAAGHAVLAYAATDGTRDPWTGTLPVGPGYWYSAPAPAVPVGGQWATARPWMMSSPDQFRSEPPPAFGSPEFQTALAEIRHMSDTRTPEQLRIAQFWQTGIFPGAVSGYFGTIAAGFAADHGYDELQAARLFAVLHMALMDAGIGCFDAKYAYSYVRPYQADAAITTPVGLPNFPSYPSLHSCFTSTAAGVLGGFFPEQTDDLQALVVEAGHARMYAGLHFMFDVTAGRDLGVSVARLALEQGPDGHHQIPLH